MDAIQITVLSLLMLFYVAYYIKAFMLKRQGIKSNLLGKGEKPKAARRVELFLRAVTLIGAVVQFGSAVFSDVVLSLPTVMPVQIAGVVLMLTGDLFFISAMLTMRDNWRAGFTANQNTSLVTHGIYGISRNPAFVGFDLIYIGCVAAFPNIINIAVMAAAVALFHIQILGEEKYCAGAFGQEYLTYKSKARRYL